MSGPFAPGDVVVCVDDLGPPEGDPWEPRLHGIYRVRDCIPDRNWTEGSERYSDPWAVDLWQDPYGGDGEGWPSKMFRKIDDEVTHDFREQLRSLKSHTPAGVIVRQQTSEPVAFRSHFYSPALSSHSGAGSGCAHPLGRHSAHPQGEGA